ncbi:MAG: signal peptidase I [Vallitaleaceae bacterium]|jgi:signal peptidase I|nr:signal peptidase I [Vallitaleaceae bacterium]
MAKEGQERKGKTEKKDRLEKKDRPEKKSSLDRKDRSEEKGIVGKKDRPEKKGTILKTRYVMFRFIIVILTILLILRLCFWPTRVVGHSMESALENNDIVIISMVKTFMHDYQYDELVVVTVPNAEERNESVVKRIIGKPGDHIVIEEDHLYINGIEKIETYRKGVMLDSLDYYVPASSYFILGDNRSISRDSRIYGCVDEAKITDMVIMKLF